MSSLSALPPYLIAVLSLSIKLALIVALSFVIARRCRARGMPPAVGIVLLVVLWLVGEFAGGVVGFILYEGMFPAEIHLCSFVGGITGVLHAFIIFNFVPKRYPYREFEGLESHFYDRPPDDSTQVHDGRDP